MNTLSKHIEMLLLDHDCIVVPQFGGFITNYAESETDYDANGECSLYPPVRYVRFNQHLKMDDGLLIHAYMTTFDTSYVAASKQVQADLLELMDELNLNGQVQMGSIGTLHQSLDGRIQLESAESGITTPRLFGLSSLSIESIEAISQQRDIKKLLETTQLSTMSEPASQEAEQRQHAPLVIRISRLWIDLGISAAAAAVLLILFLLPSNMGSSANGTDTVFAGSIPSALTLQRHRTTASPAAPAATQAAQQDAAPVATQRAQSPAPASQTKGAAASSATYTIVLASYVSEKNAGTFIEKITRSGFTHARFDNSGKVSRILYSSYSTEERAVQALRELRSASKDFAQAWIMRQ